MFRSSVRFHLDCIGRLHLEPKPQEFSLLDLGLSQMECISEQWEQTNGRKTLENDCKKKFNFTEQYQLRIYFTHHAL